MRKLLLLSVSILIVSLNCHAQTDKELFNLFSKHGLLEDLKIGDSIQVNLGDSIQLEQKRNATFSEKGNILIIKRDNGKFTYSRIGEWLMYNYYGQHSAKLVYDLELGLIKEYGWNHYSDSASVHCDNHRTLVNDSLIEYQKWYYPNGILESEKKYLIGRKIKNHQYQEKKTLLENKKYFNAEGEKLKKKYLKGK